LATTVCLPEI